MVGGKGWPVPSSLTSRPGRPGDGRGSRPPVVLKRHIDQSSTRPYGLSMSSIPAFEAKTRFGELLERVASGESITITRHGTPVARIVPVAGPDPARRRAAIDRLRTFNSGQTLGGLSLRALIEEGRA